MKKEKDGKFKDKIFAYALKNAIEHNGKALSNNVLNSLFHEGLDKKDIKSVIPKINKIVEKINSLSLEEQKEKFSSLDKEVSHREERAGLPELENVPKTGVVMRFAPSPSGPMHIGHAATGMPSSLYVKKYGGKFFIRIEDTNPKNIDPQAYSMIRDEANWLFGNVSEFIIQSDRMKKYYDFAEKLINKGEAYVCDCNPEEFKKLLKKSKPCPCRTLSAKEQLARWKKMLDKKGYLEGKAVLLFKSDLKHKNPALRDFPLARIIKTKHPKQGTKYRVWPLMNLSVTADDIEYGMTHIIRAKEHKDNALRQEMMYKVLGERKFPKTFFLGRYKFTDLEISCSKTKKLIEEGKFSGWNDIRLPFLAALRKRGYQPEAFEKMAIQRGISEVDKVIHEEDFFETLNNFNRQILKIKSEMVSFEKAGSKDKNSLEILMPNNSLIYCKSNLDKKTIKEGALFYFDGFGYCRYNKSENQFWFCHK